MKSYPRSPRTRVRLATVAAAAVTAVAGPALPVLGHGGVVPEPVVESLPDLDGLQAEGLVAYAPRIEVTNDAATELTVIDDSGAPWLRISSEGVFADLSTRRWYESIDSTGRGIDPPADAPDGWTQVSTLPRWGWFDRDLLPREDPEADHTWTIPVIVDGTFDEITGDLVESDLQGRWVTSLEGDGTIGTARLTAVSGSVPVFVVQRLDAEEVIVLGPYDEPMIRLTEAGFEVNLASPGWNGHARLDPQASVGTVVEDPDAEPVWSMRLEGAPTATWVDPRGAARDLVPSRRSETEVPFTLPIMVDGQRLDVAASTTWVGDEIPLIPVRLSVTTLIALSLGAGLLAAAGVRFWDRRKAARAARAAGDEDGASEAPVTADA